MFGLWLIAFGVSERPVKMASLRGENWTGEDFSIRNSVNHYAPSLTFGGDSL